MLKTLRLVSRPGAIWPVTAWFLPGADAGHWLEELAAGDLALPGTSLYVVPQSVEDRRPAGLLVIPPKGHTASQPLRGMACGTIGERLLLPVDAELNPPLSEVELRELCRLPLLFFHPSLGLSGFEAESCLRIGELLERPGVAPDDWNCARPGPSAMASLERIEVARPTDEDIFGEESKEIGSEAGDPLPSAPDEPKEDAWSKARRAVGHKGAKFVADILRRLPHVGKSRNWLNGVEDWANRQAARFAADLERLRNKELHRLLHLLDNDPEKGLRHALPLNDFPHRGRAPAGGSLGSHDLDFNVRRLGGGPADFWAVAPDLREELTRRYRKLADRELHLKRYRRAAYIYAELLGDLPSAANALKQGRHFHEAALLYEERLNNPLAAAQCLAEGGLLREAIERYEKLGRLLEVADLYEKLEDRPAAQKTLRRLVEQHLAAGDSLGAAQLLERRLAAPDEALQVLEEAWPGSRQAVQCLGAQLDLLARLGRHETAAQGLARLRRDKIAGSHLEPLAGLLADLAGRYPDQRVRHAAGDMVRVLASERLSEPQAQPVEAQRLVSLLYRLAPQDRLLVRDGNRHLARRRQRQREQEAASRSVATVVAHACVKGPLEPKVLHRFELLEGAWLQVKTDGLGFFAAVVKGANLILVRGGWNGTSQSIRWPCSEYAAKSGLALDLFQDPDRRTRVLLSVVGQPGLRDQILSPDLFFPRPSIAGTLGWLSPEMHPFAVIGSNLWALHLASGRAVLSCYDLQGSLRRTDDVTEGLLADAQRTETTRLSLVNLDGRWALGLGNRLLVQQGQQAVPIDLPGQVTRLVPTLPHTRAGVVILFDQGAAVHWLGTGQVIDLDRDNRWIAATWIPSGKLILISAHEGRLYDVDSRGVTAVRSFPWHGSRPIAVTTVGEPSYFAIFTAKGEVSIFHAGEK